MKLLFLFRNSQIRQQCNESTFQLTEKTWVCGCVGLLPIGGMWGVHITSRELQHFLGWTNTWVWVRFYMKQFWWQTVMRQVWSWRDVNLQLGCRSKWITDTQDNLDSALLMCMLRPTRQGRFTHKKTETSNYGCSMVESPNQVKNMMCAFTLVQVSWSLPVTGLSRRRTEDGLRISAKNL